MGIRSYRKLLAGTSCLGALIAAGLLPAPAAAADSTPAGIEEITVTAGKRTERLQDVPLSVSAIEPAELTAEGLTQARDFLTRVPGVAIQEGQSGTTQVVIRGITTGTGGNPLVGITIDDVPFGSATFAGLGSTLIPDLDPNDLNQIEVLRGPQGTLYGASAMGGLIKYDTTQPSLTQTSGRVEIDDSDSAHGGLGYGLRAAASTPLVDNKVGLSLSGYKRMDPGYISDPAQNQNDVNATRSYGGRAALRIEPTDQLSIKLSVLAQNKSSSADSMEDVAFGGTPLTGDYQHERLPGSDSYAASLRLYNGTIAYDFGPVTLSSISAYTVSHYDGLYDYSRQFQGLGGAVYGLTGLGYRFENEVTNDKFSEEVRLASNGDGPLQYMAGLFYTRENSVLWQNIDPADPVTGALNGVLPTLLHSRIPTNYKEIAAFGNVTYNITPDFSLQLGGRVSRIDQNYVEDDQGILASDAAGSSHGTPATYTVTPAYHFDHDSMVYARLATGYRAGGPNPSQGPGIPSAYTPDHTVNYELGTKDSFLDRKLTLDVSLFRINWHNIQVAESDPVSGNTYFANAGNAHSQGVEGSLGFKPITGLRLAGSVSLSQAVLEDGLPATSNNAAAPGALLPYSPRWSGNFSADYERPINDDTTAYTGFTVAYTDHRQADFKPTLEMARYDMPSYVTVDFRTGVHYGQWDTSLFVKNIGDERGVIGVRGLTSAEAGPYGLSLIQPRTVGLTLARQF